MLKLFFRENPAKIKTMTKKDITDACLWIRNSDVIIPDEVLNFMRDAAIEKLEKCERDRQKTYTLFWLDGKCETVTGTNIDDAMTKRGYGQGAMAALDFHAGGDIRDQYKWNGELKRWDNKL